MSAVAVNASSALRRRSGFFAFAVLFVILQALLWYAYYGHGAKTLIGDEQTYQDAALSILAGGAWQTSTIWPPLQPLFMAALYRIFGVHLLAVQLAQMALLILCAALLRGLWRRVGGSVAAANAATALFLLLPTDTGYAQWLWPETLHLALVLGAFRLLLTQPVARAAAALAGACLGIAVLAKSLLTGFWPLALVAFTRRERPRCQWRSALAFLIGLAVVTAPALWHGWREFGRPTIADSSVYNLWVGLTERWRSDYIEDMGGLTLPAFLASGATPQQRNAVYLDKVRALLAERGFGRVLADQLGRQYFRLFSAKTALISQLPGSVCAGHLSVYASPPWLTRTLTAWSDVLHALLLAACAFGIATWRRRPDRALALIGLYVAYQLALMLGLHVKARFLFPLVPFLCGFAGSFLATLRGRMSGDRRVAAAAAPAALAADGFTPVRLVLGAALALVLLGLAFLGPVLDHSCG